MSRKKKKRKKAQIMGNNAQQNKVPELGLGELLSCHPKVFDGDTKDKDTRNLHGFFLTLALIYNDLKDLDWWIVQLGKGKPVDINTPSSYLGEHNGMCNHVVRLFYGLLAELLTMIDKNKSVLNHPTFLLIKGKLGTTTNESWEDLVNLSEGRIAHIQHGKELHFFLQTIRSNGIFHYENIRGHLNGYKTFFETPHRLNQRAYYAAGPSMETSRFYFADAAMQGYEIQETENFHKKVGGATITLSRLRDGFGPRINNALRFLVEEFIKLRETELTKK